MRLIASLLFASALSVEAPHFSPDDLSVPDVAAVMESGAKASPRRREDSGPRRRRRLDSPDPLAEFRACGCLSCRLIVTLMEHQAERHGQNWNAGEAMHGLANASAMICQEIEGLAGDAATTASGGPADQLHGLVLERIAQLKMAAGGPLQGFRSTIH
jgi:hypothetical protein